MNYFTPFLCASALFPMVISTTAVARSTFLPDWQETNIGGEGSDNDFNKDENYCIEAEDIDGSKFYHRATSCPAPKKFDETCPTDPNYISKCYCPEEYTLTCDAPLRGNSTYSCDGLWASCCDTTCPSGTSQTDPGGCGGSTTNDCGDTCYYPYQPCCYPESSESGCECGTHSCGDGCGGTRTCCNSCSSSGSGGDSSGSDGGSSGSGGGGGSSGCQDYNYTMCGEERSISGSALDSARGNWSCEQAIAVLLAVDIFTVCGGTEQVVDALVPKL